MNIPDLTPTTFTERVKAQQAVQRWILPLGACALLALVPIALEFAQPPDTHGKLAEERVVQARARVESAQSQIASKQSTLSQKQRELQAAQHLTKRPDWSIVLGLIARQFDDELMMTGCQLGEAKSQAVRRSLGALRSDVEDDSMWMILNGVAASNSNVPGLIMRLESLGLFDRVVMTGSQRESFAGGSRMIFTLACKVQ